MTTNPSVELWLEVSAALARDLFPKGAGLETFGHGMPPEQFASLVDRESARVDHALVAMSVAANEDEVRAIAAQLGADTLIALFSRWAHYTRMWQPMLRDPNPKLWVPPRLDDIWRAVLLAMTHENSHSTEAARRLWPELAGGSRP